MYINHLGMRNVGKLRIYEGARQRTVSGMNFSETLKSAEESQIKQEELKEDPSACCEQCSENNQLLKKLIIQSLYMRYGSSSLGLTGYGYPLTGMDLLGSYQSL